MSSIASAFRDIPVAHIDADPHPSRLFMASDPEDQHLLQSIASLGIMAHLVVNEIKPGRYLIIDGYRRLVCARKTALTTVPCRVHVGMPPGVCAALRFWLNHTHRRPTKVERAAMRKCIEATERAMQN